MGFPKPRGVLHAKWPSSHMYELLTALEKTTFLVIDTVALLDPPATFSFGPIKKCVSRMKAARYALRTTWGKRERVTRESRVPSQRLRDSTEKQVQGVKSETAKIL